MPDHLQEIAAAAMKAEQLAAQRIAPRHLLHLQRQAGKALPHVGVTGRQPNPNPCRQRHHGSVSSPRTIRSRPSTSTAQSTTTRRPFALTISIRPQPGPVAASGCSGTINAGTNPAISPATSHEWPCAKQTAADLRSRSGAPSPTPAADLKTLLHDPKLCRIQPTPAPAGVNNFKAADLQSISNAIHTDSQLPKTQLRKTAYAGRLRCIRRIDARI